MDSRSLSDSPTPNWLFAPQARQRPSSIYLPVHQSHLIIASLHMYHIGAIMHSQHVRHHHPFLIAFVPSDSVLLHHLILLSLYNFSLSLYDCPRRYTCQWTGNWLWHMYGLLVVSLHVNQSKGRGFYSYRNWPCLPRGWNVDSWVLF